MFTLTGTAFVSLQNMENTHCNLIKVLQMVLDSFVLVSRLCHECISLLHKEEIPLAE